MSDTLAQIDEFRRFAESRVAAGDRRSIAELFEEWREEGSPPSSEEDDLRAVEEALRDYDAGDRGRPYDEAIAEIRAKHGLR